MPDDLKHGRPKIKIRIGFISDQHHPGDFGWHWFVYYNGRMLFFMNRNHPLSVVVEGAIAHAKHRDEMEDFHASKEYAEFLSQCG